MENLEGREYIVISDLHIGINDDMDILKPNRDSLISFLVHLQNRNVPTELIINGDFVDFLQVSPYEQITKKCTIEKMNAIVTAQQEIFNALHGFIQQPGNRLVVLVGNHDVELILDVQVFSILTKTKLTETANKFTMN